MLSSRPMRLLPLLLFVLSTFGFAQTAAPAKKSAPASAKATTSAAKTKTAATTKTASGLPTIKYTTFRLKNGLNVIVSEDHRLPMVAVNLWYHVGPANEAPGRTGFAHLFEHMMFSGSKHIQGPKGESEHFKLLAAAGATGINGSTDFDRTNYYETVPSNQVELALWIESDRMGFLLDTIDGQKLITQRDVVRNERRQSGENVPYGLSDEQMDHQLYGQGHPYYGSVIGSHKDIESARLDNVRDFFKQYYTPNNATLALVGDITEAKAKQLVEKYFGTLPEGPAVPKLENKTAPITAEKRVTVTDTIELPQVTMGWLSPSIYKPGDADADILAQIIGGGKASRMYKSMVYDKKIAQNVSAGQRSLILGSNFQMSATAKPGTTPEELEKAMQEEIDRMRNEGPTPAEVASARAAVESRLINSLESFNGVANRLNSYEHYVGDPGFLPKQIKEIDAVTADSVKKLAQDVLKDNARVVIYTVKGQKVVDDVPRTNDPEEAKQKAGATEYATNEDWRKDQPKAGPTPNLTLPVPTVTHLANGLTVMLIERHNLPLVTASLVVNAGSERNPAEKAGLAAFTAAMLQEGTDKRSSLQIAEDVESIGAFLNSNSTTDNSDVTMRVLKKNMDTGFDLMSDVALHPAFAEKEFDRVRQRRLTQVLQQKDSAVQLGNQVFSKLVYGDNHPYGQPEIGTAASLKTINRDDLMNFYKSGYAPGNAALLVAGDITAAQLKEVAEKYFGKWSGKAEPFKLAATPEAATRKFVIVDKPGAPQTALYVGQVGLARNSPDFPTAQVLNTALGGIFSARINMNLREAHGYTYGASSRFVYRREPGPFFVYSSVRTNVTGPSVHEIFNELDGMKTRPLSADEVKLAKDYIVGAMAALFETSNSVVNSMGTLYTYHLPNNYYREYPAQIKAVTPEKVQALAAKVLKPDTMTIVAVGDRAKIEPELKALNLGDVEVRDADAKPVSGGTSGSDSTTHRK